MLFLLHFFSSPLTAYHQLQDGILDVSPLHRLPKSYS